jgi:hypothetical protein
MWVGRDLEGSDLNLFRHFHAETDRFSGHFTTLLRLKNLYSDMIG